MERHLGYGVLSYDVAHLMGTAVLVLSFALLFQRRITAVVHIYALQAMVLAAAACWQGYVQNAPALYLTGLITMVAKGIAIPTLLYRILRQLAIHRTVDTALDVFASMVLGVALVALSISVVMHTTLQEQNLTREDLSLALSVVLLGMLVMITRRHAITQVVGFMSLENGLILAAVGVVGMPLVVELAVAVLVMVAAVVFGMFFLRIRERFDSLDARHLDRVGGAHR
jgi:hydrogenase-4 component E